MKETDEDRALANLYLNLKGPKKKRSNWIKIAQDCKQLTDQYGSAKEVAEKLGVDYEIVRSLLKLLTLPEEVKRLIENNEILFDVGQRITRIDGEENQIRVAKAVIGLTNHEAREVIQYARKFPNAPLDDFRKRVIKNKNRVENIHLAIIPLGEDTYKQLKTIGEKENVTLERLILKIVKQWIENRDIELQRCHE